MTLPHFCRRAAFRHFAAQLPHLETTPALVQAAVAISLHELSDASPEGVAAEIERLSGEVRRRVRSGNEQALLAHLHDVLFDEAGFQGAVDDYYNPRNSYLPAVLADKRGLPITLTLLYKSVAEPLGLVVQGINAPGHFLASVGAGEGLMYVDPFYGGRVLRRDEVFDRIAEASGRAVEPDDRHLAVASHRQWISRMLNNLQAVFARDNRLEELGAMQELQALL